MKRLLIYILFLTSSFSVLGKAAQDNPTEVIAIEKAIANSDMRLLGLLMDDWIAITYDNKANIYNKYHAQSVVSDILSFESEKSFQLQKVGKGNSTNSYFVIGTYTATNKQYLLYFYLVYNTYRKQYLLKEIKID